MRRVLRHSSNVFFDESGALRASFEANDFEVLGVAADVSLDPKELDTKMRALQRQLHPDLFARASTEQKQRAEVASARVNAAYATLRDPVLRADRAISLKIGRVLEDSQEVDAALLASMMEAREAIEEASDDSDLRALLEEATADVETTLRSIEASYNAGAYDDAAKNVVRLQYYAKLQKDINEALSK